MPLRIEYDFSDYVATRKGEAAARTREGAAYAYGGDLKVRATLGRVRPVTLAMTAALRSWQSSGKKRLLADAIRVDDAHFPTLQGVLGRSAQALQVAPPPLYVSPQLEPLARLTVGTSEDAIIVIGSGLADNLTENELVAALGFACGHVQNHHTEYLTTLYLLDTASNLVVRWAGQPAAVGLRGWLRRAELTCDRASLLAARSLNVAQAALIKMTLGTRQLVGEIDVDGVLREIDRMVEPIEQVPAEPAAARSPNGHASEGPFAALLAANPFLPTRIQALRLFAETTVVRSLLGQTSTTDAPGITKEECDARVSELVAVMP